MLLLWLFGRELEPQLGTPIFLGIYFSCLLAGAFGALVFSPDALTVGASGAIFGLMGAAAAILYARGINPFQTDIGMLIVFNLVLSFVLSNVSVGGHVGGLVGGIIGGLAVAAGERRRQSWIGWAGLAGCRDRLGDRRRDGRPQRRHRPRDLTGTSSAGPGACGTARGCRMWASVSSPSTSRGPGRENVAEASIATTRRAPSDRSCSACASASSSERAAS